MLVYNYARVAEDVLAGAKETVARLYADASVDLMWIDPPIGSGAASFDPRASRDRFTARVIVRSQFDVPAMGFVRGGTPRGRADEGAGQVTSGMAFLSFDAIVEVARQRQQRPSDVLGYVMAHEIAHLLLPSVEHARYGMMRRTWEEDDFRRMAAGYLRFTASEAAAIRAGARRACRVRPGAGTS